MSWSASNYCFSARLPARERLCSHSSRAQGSAAASVLPQSRLGLRGVSALWAGLLAANDGLRQNGIANFASSANNFEWSWSESPSASTDRLWQELIISSVFPLSVNSEVRPTRPTLSQLLLSVHVAAVVWLLCCQYAGDILLRDSFQQIQMVQFPFFPWTWPRQKAGWESAGRQPGKRRYKVQGAGRWASGATQDAVASRDCTVAAQLHPPLPTCLAGFEYF